MITGNDLRTLYVMQYLVENLRPALMMHLNRRRYDAEARDLESVEYTAERIKADLKKIRRLALIISKNIE